MLIGRQRLASYGGCHRHAGVQQYLQHENNFLLVTVVGIVPGGAAHPLQTVSQDGDFSQGLFIEHIDAYQRA